MNRPEWNETCSQAPCNREKFDPSAPTPLERLEKWLQEDAVDHAAVFYVNPDNDGWSVELWGHDYSVGYGVAPTFDAAIVAALAQVKEEAKNG